MKKTRMISLFLSVIMTASSLPVMVNAEEATDVLTPYGTELLAGDYLNTTKWSGLGVASVDADNTNKLLRMDERGHHGAECVLTLNGIDLEADVEYTITLNARAQGDNMYLLLNPCNRNETVYSRIAPANYNYLLAKTAADYVFTIKSKVTQENANVEFKLRGNFADSISPVEIDYAKIAKWNATKNEWETAGTWDFNESAGTARNWSWKSNNTAQVSATWVGDKDYIRVSAIEWDASETDTDDITARYEQAATYSTGEIKLTAGEYELTFDARQSEFFGDYEHNQIEYTYEYNKLLEIDSGAKPAQGVRVIDVITEANKSNLFYYRNKPQASVKAVDATDTELYHIIYYKDNMSFDSNDRDVAVTLKAKDGSAIKTDNVTFDTEWETKTVTFTVPSGKEYTLSSISFGGTGYAYDNDEFDISNLSLKLVELFHEDEPIGSDLLAGAQHNGTTVDAVYDAYEKNGFISAYRFNWMLESGVWNCDSAYFNLKLDEQYNSQYTYYVQYDIRHSVPTNDDQYIVTQIMKNTDAVNYSLNGGAWSTTDGKGFPITAEGGDWETRTYALPSGSYSGEVTVCIRRNRGNPRAQDIPVDIDNLVVWKESAGGDGVLTDADISAGNVLYNEDFNNENWKYTATTAVYNKIYNTSEALTLYHNFDREYATASKLEYTGLESLEDNGEGIYIFKADVRVPYFYYYNVRANGASELGTDEAAKETFLAYNKHTVKITFTMTDGTTSKEKTVTRKEALNPMWSTIEASVTVNEGYNLSKITVTPVFNSTFAENVTGVGIDFRSASLTKIERQEGGLNIGILMVLLKKKEAQLGEWDDPWEDAGFN